MAIKFSTNDNFHNNLSTDFPEPVSGITPDVIRLQNDTSEVLTKLAERYGKNKENSFVGSGRQAVIGSVEGELPLFEEGSYRKVYTQTPVASVIIKKRPFSSLKHLYNPIYMNSADKWLYRATKKLVQRKCAILADYEKLSKISNMLERNYSPAEILVNFQKDNIVYETMVRQAEDFVDLDEYKVKQSVFYENLKALIVARKPTSTTTYYQDPFLPVDSDFGLGEGVFELSSVSNIRTELSIDGSGGRCSFSLEDPNRILLITGEDIEFAIRDTAKEGQSIFREKMSSTLREAQIDESELNLSRVSKNKNPVIFFVDENGNAPRAILENNKIEIQSVERVPLGQEFSKEEKELYNRIVKNLTDYSSAMVEGKLKGADFQKQKGKELDYVRSRMRLFYLGKSLVQPMDEVHVFINGGTRPMTQSLFTESKSTGSNIETDISEVSFKQDDRWLLQEWEPYRENISFETFKKIMLLGNDPGMHVFAGLVIQTSDKYSNGKFTMSVECDCNMQWVKMSRYNSEPSLDQTSGLVHDPLTALEYSLDPATGLPIGEPRLLEENENRIQAYNFMVQNGVNQGQIVKTLDDLKISNDFQQGRSISVFQHVPGLVYQWKQGVMTATYNLSLRSTSDLSVIDSKHLRRDMGFFWSHKAFDNLDAANIISILVTGIPYNYATFVQSSKHAFVANATQDTSKSFFNTFLDYQQNNVKAHGNFIPFKTVLISQEAAAWANNMQIQLTGASVELQQLRAQYADITDRVSNFSNMVGGGPELSGLEASLKKKAENIGSKINSLQIDLEKNLQSQHSKETSIQVAGDDVMFDVNDEDSVKYFNDRLLYATQRRKEDVIYNKDKNYFIVSDEYDKDYDIQAFILMMKNQSPELFKNTWADAFSLCKDVAKNLDFEFFADTQGHIIFRPPQYNKTPLTVLKNMLELYRNSGIKLISDPILKLYVSREESIIRDVVALEWEIAKNGALLGYKINSTTTSFLDWEGGRLSSVKYIFDIEEKYGLSFIIGSVWGGLRNAIVWSEAITPEQRAKTLDLIKSANASTQLSSTDGQGMFSAVTQTNMLQNKEKTTSDKESYDLAIAQLAMLKGTPLRSFPEFEQVEVNSKKNGISTPTTNKSTIISEISKLISRRAILLRTLEKIMSKTNEIGEVKDGVLQVKTISSDNLIENELNNRFIEDDTKHIFGYMSGSRFIIKDEHIYNSNFSEKPPSMTTMVVRGGEPIIGMAKEGDAIGINYIAFGADFDMWRQYGWRGEGNTEKPFFTSAELQCAPYALMMLSRQRKNIITGTVSVIGNEFYQLGDVVYLANRQMLYYVDKISHDFQYGKNFTTTLSLTYGHPPGEYIPTPLDIIGKTAIRQGSSNTYRMIREASKYNKHLCTVKFEDDITESLNEEVFLLEEIVDPFEYETEKGKSYLTNKYKTQNVSALEAAGARALSEGVGVLPNSPKLFVVTYSSKDGEGQKEQKHRREAIKRWFVEGKKVARSISGEGSKEVDVPVENEKSEFLLPEESVVSLHVDIVIDKSSKLENYSPLEKELLQKMQFVADQESYAFDPSLLDVVEVRLVGAPKEGWMEWGNKRKNSFKEV